MNPYLLHHLLAESAQRFPDRDAIVSGNRAMTYGELDYRSDRISSALRTMGVSAGDRVGICMGKSIEAIVFLFGSLKAGAAYVPIDHLAPQIRLEYIVRNCDIHVLFSTKERAAKLLPVIEDDSPLRKIVVPGKDETLLPCKSKTFEIFCADDLYEEEKYRHEKFDFSDTNPAYILHTSGSTGMPKGVCLSHMNSMSFVKMAADFFHIEKEDRLASHAPLHFDLSVFDIFTAVAKGSAIVLVPENLAVFPMKLAEFIQEEKISVWNSVASVLSLLAERGRLDRFAFGDLKTVIFSGETLPVKYLRKMKRSMPGTQFFNVYGQTEANSSMVYPVTDIPESESWKIPIGRPFPNFEVFALGENGEILKQPGQFGELYVRSSSVAAGYWGDEVKTLENFVTDPRSPLTNRKIYRTGDLVMLDEENKYLLIGRKDQQVKSRGYRIQLNEIETVLTNHPAIKEAVVVAIPDELIGNRIVSHVSVVDGMELIESELLRYCNTILPTYMLPEKIFFQKLLPKTQTGKIDRNLLRNSTILLS